MPSPAQLSRFWCCILHRSIARHAAWCLLLLLGLNFASVGAQVLNDFSNKETVQWSNIGDTVFKHISTQQGLPQYSATAIMQDRDGFIWVGTQGGLARWDGYHFRNYLPQLGNEHSLPDNYVLALYLDPKGNLWVGTNGGGLARYDPHHDNFERYEESETGLSQKTVLAICGDGKNGLWLATRAGLNHFDPDTGKFERYYSRANDENSLQSDFIRAVYHDTSGKLWVGTSKGLAVRDDKSAQFTRIVLPTDPGKGQRVMHVNSSQDGKIWVGTFDSGAYYFNPENLTPHRLLLRNEQTSALEPLREYIYTMGSTRDNQMWLGSYGKGILVIDTRNFESKRLLHEPNRPSSLSDNSIWSIFFDRSGLIWVGGQRGLNIHDPSSHAFVSLFGAENPVHGLAGIDFFSAFEFPDGSLWVGSQNQGLSILRRDSKRFEVIPANDKDNETALPPNAIFSFLLTSHNQVFIGTDRGMYLSDPKASFIRHLTLAPRNPVLRVASMLELQGKLIFAGNEGIWEKDLADMAHDTSAPATWAAVVAKKFVTDMKLAPDGSIWIATSQDGIYRFDLEKQSAINYKPIPKQDGSLTHVNVASLLFDSRGWLWIATQGGGIDLLKEPKGLANPTFIHFRKNEGLQNELINKVLEDKGGYIWVSTDDGLAKVDPHTFQVFPLTERDGVAISGYWSNAGISTQRGHLLFGGVGGLTMVRPELLREYTYRPPIVVSNIQIGGKLVAANHSNFVAPAKEKLIVTPDANSIAVEFSALDFSDSEHNLYAYKLEGYDKDWIETDQLRRLAAYTNLPPGKYRLHLRGSNRRGVWTEPHLVLDVVVKAAWYQTWWAYLLYLALFTALVMALLRWRLWSLQNNNKLLARLILERTQELEQSKKLLEEKSLTDYLTGLHNRRYLYLCIDEDIARVRRAYQNIASFPINRAQHKNDIVFMMVDIDHFKTINDEYGHSAGDEVLRQTARILKELIRESDTIIRWGGEEFLIVVRETNHVEAEVLAERIRAQFSAHAFIFNGGARLHRSCSIGLCTFPFMPDALERYSWEQVVDIADQCLYAAKHAGRDAWVGLFLLGESYPATHQGKLAVEIEEHVRSGHLSIRTSLPSTINLDWSHGRDL